MRTYRKAFALVAIITACLAFRGTAMATPIDARISIYGDDFLQSFSVQNNSDAGLSINTIVYSLGTFGNGIATWDTLTGGGTASDFLDSRCFQTVTWSGLSIGPGSSFTLPSQSLDIDVIEPGAINGWSVPFGGSSLGNAYFGIGYNNGYFARAALNETPWTTDQNLHIESVRVPEPEPSILLLLGSGLAGLLAFRKKPWC